MERRYEYAELAATTAVERAAPWLQRQLAAELATVQRLSAECQRLYTNAARELAAGAAAARVRPAGPAHPRRSRARGEVGAS